MQKRASKKTSGLSVPTSGATEAKRSGKKRDIIGVERHRHIEFSDSDSLAALKDGAGSNRGDKLPEPLTEQWEERLDENLSRFRVHTDSRTAAAVDRGRANAVNFGEHLFFGSGRYRPETEEGRELLGHELAHAIQSRPAEPGTAARIEADQSREAEAARVGEALNRTDQAVRVASPGTAPPALRGDKQIAFSDRSITVTDTYVIYGPGANSAFVTRFQNALDNYYNNPAFTYRGYTVNFNLSVRMRQTVTRTVGLFDWESTDWSSDSDTSLFYVETGSGRAGGFNTYTLYESSTEGTIAHEVGHYLSDRVGYFSEGYTESFTSRLGITERHTEVRPEAAGDVMARSQTGTVGDFSLGGILDEAINAHEGLGYDWSGEQSHGFEYWDFCWVAREVVPADWRWVRRYLLRQAPSWLRNLYGRHGRVAAGFIRDKPVLKRLLRPLFQVLAGKGKRLRAVRPSRNDGFEDGA
ncbi:MAG: eCIS core domain-containing protein [Gammaproteobacteria bacterium]